MGGREMMNVSILEYRGAIIIVQIKEHHKISYRFWERNWNHLIWWFYLTYLIRCGFVGLGLRRGRGQGAWGCIFFLMRIGFLFCPRRREELMGASCCGLTDGGQRRGRSRYRMNRSVRLVRSSHSAAEPLLRENEREAVSNLLRYLEEGS